MSAPKYFTLRVGPLSGRARGDASVGGSRSDEEPLVTKPRKKRSKKKKKGRGRGTLGGSNVAGNLMGGPDSDSDLTEDTGSEGSDSTHVSLNDDESVDVRAHPLCCL